MKLLVIGATRGIGARLAEQALGRGHDITVLARDPERVETRSGDINIFKGDILDRGPWKWPFRGRTRFVLL